ncbi:hypothetical protein VTN00DRAFT_4567 [Thermoascus crustaceus]
MLEDIGF